MDFFDASVIQIIKIYGICAICFFNLKFIDKQFDPNKKLNITLRIFLTLITSYLYYTAMPKSAKLYSSTTMIQSALVGIPILKTLQIFLFSDTKTRVKLTFFQYLLQFLWPLIPIKSTPKIEHLSPSNPMKIIEFIIKDILPLLLLSYQSLIWSQYFGQYLFKCLNDKEIVNIICNNYLYLCYYSLIQLLCIISDICTQNAMYGIIKLFTLNRYKWLEMNNYPLFSISITELWSKRYNQLIRTLLHQTIFIPFINYGFSKQFAAFSAFFASGLLHVYVAYKTFGYGLINTLIFFVLHGTATVIESIIYGKERNYRNRDKFGVMEIMLRVIITMTFFVLTIPLYIGLFIQAYPEWGINNGSKGVSNIYGVNEVVKMLPDFECYYP